MRQVLIRIVDIFRHFQVPFTTPGARIVIGMADPLHLVLVRQMMPNTTERLHQSVVLTLEDRLRQLELGEPVAIVPLNLGALVQTPDRRQHRPFFQTLHIAVLLHHLVDHVGDPRAHRFHQHLCAFPLQKAEHVEVAVPFGRLRPELPGDFNNRLYAQTVYLDFVKHLAAAVQRAGEFVSR